MATTSGQDEEAPKVKGTKKQKQAQASTPLPNDTGCAARLACDVIGKPSSTVGHPFSSLHALLACPHTVPHTLPPRWARCQVGGGRVPAEEGKVPAEGEEGRW